jgi:hypothetical protein
VAHHGKPLAGRATKHNIHVSTTYPSMLSDFGTSQFGDRLRQHDAMREVVGVYCAMDGVYFNRAHDIEPGLLEA